MATLSGWSKELPTVSVIMPVFNGARYIRAAIESILGQTFQDIELIVVDDGSSDNTASMVQGFTDYRINYIYQENQGCSRAINRGLQVAKAGLIAHCDCDDIWNREKLRKQVLLLEAQIDTVLVGSWATIIDEYGSKIGTHKHKSKSTEIKIGLIFENPFVHSSIIYRKDIAEKIGGYSDDTRLTPPEDYEFIARMAQHGQVKNIRELLVKYRHHGSGLSKRRSDEIYERAIKISKLYIESIDNIRLAQTSQCLATFAKDYRSPITADHAKALLDLTRVLKEKMYFQRSGDWIWYIALVAITLLKKSYFYWESRVARKD